MSTVNESFYRDCLAESLNGSVEVKTPVGVIDVLTEDEIIEVKTVTGWKAALGQIVAYGVHYPERRKRIHLIGKPSPEIKKVCEVNNVVVTWQPSVVFSKEETIPVEVERQMKLLTANKRLRSNGHKISLAVMGKNFNFYARGMFPSKKGTGTKQQRLALWSSALAEGDWDIAEHLAIQVAKDVQRGTFKWATWTHYRISQEKKLYHLKNSV